MILLLSFCLPQESSELDRLAARLRENPKDVAALLQRASEYQRTGQHDKGLADIEEAVRLDPSNPQAHLSRGMILMALKRTGEAHAAWDRAVQLDPRLRPTVDELKKGRMPRRGFRPEDVFEELREWLGRHEPETLRRLESLRAEGRHDEFARQVQEALQRRNEFERDPESHQRWQRMRQLERETFDLAERVRRGEDVRRELFEKLAALFDLREEQRARELADLKRRVDELEKILQKRRENRTSIIEKRLREMTGEKSVDEW